MPPPAKIDPEKEKSINQFLHITEDFGAAKKLLEQNRLQQVGQSFKKPPHPKEQRHISDQLSQGLSSHGRRLVSKRVRPQSSKLPVNHGLNKNHSQSTGITVQQCFTNDRELQNVAEVRVGSNVGLTTIDKLKTTLTSAGYRPRFLREDGTVVQLNKRPMSGKPQLQNIFGSHYGISGRGPQHSTAGFSRGSHRSVHEQTTSQGHLPTISDQTSAKQVHFYKNLERSPDS